MEENLVDCKLKLTQIKAALAGQVYTSIVFEYDLVAPSDLVLVIFVGLSKPKQPLTAARTVQGRYLDAAWPDQITEEQYRASQKF